MAIYTTDWFTYNIENLEKVLGHLVGVDDIHMLEIGCFEGRSTNWFLENILTGEGSDITVIDPFTGSQEEYRMQGKGVGLRERFEANMEQHSESVRIIGSDSLHGLTQLLDEGKKYDVIYVDGSHTADNVMLDAILSFRLLKVGGVIVFDDYRWQDGDRQHIISRPELAVNTFSKMYQGALGLMMKTYQVAFQKLREDDELIKIKQHHSFHILD